MPLVQTIPSLLPTLSMPQGQAITQNSDLQGGTYVSEIHGKWYAAAKAGLVWHANVTAQSLPAVAATLASKFSLYNPVGSGKVAELISLDIGSVLAATVVDIVGLYYETGNVNPTSITYGAPVNGMLGSVGNNAIRFCSALTHTSGVTPTRVSLVSTFGAVTTTADNPIHYDFDGKILIPPGTIVSVAMSTAVSTTSGIDVGASWVEWPA